MRDPDADARDDALETVGHMVDAFDPVVDEVYLSATRDFLNDRFADQ